MEEVLNPVQEQTVEVVDIQFRPGQKVYYFDPAGEKFAPGDHVIMDTARGVEFGLCAAGNHRINARDAVAPLRKILRRATAQDEKINAENRARERRAFEVCMQKIQSHGLDMQLVSAECAFDGSKILFYFTADERVDFRELVKDLAGVFHTRIELRQIGVRDKAKMVGGLGICGRPFCCASFLDDFQPVSIKMAKTQSLSLNPTKISGTCGRLMCCLKYEQDTYESLIRSSPKPESFVDTPEGRGTVVDVDILRQRVKVQMESNPETVNTFPNEEIAVLRSGKAKKNDPPIPADLAPISGNGKRPAKPKTEDAPVLDAIRFRYSTESIAEEQTAEQQPEVAEKAEVQPREERRPPRPRQPRREAAPNATEPRPSGDQPPREERQVRENRRPRRERPRRENQEQPNGAPQQGSAPLPEAAQERPEQEEKQQEQHPRRNNRPPRRPNGQNGQPPKENKSADTAPQESGERRPPRRNNNYNRRRRPKAPGSGNAAEQ